MTDSFEPNRLSAGSNQAQCGYNAVLKIRKQFNRRTPETKH